MYRSTRGRAHLQSHQNLERMLTLTLSRLEDALDYRVSIRSLLGLTALRYLPSDHPRTQSTLRRIVGRRDQGILEKPQGIPALMVLK